LFNKYSSQFLVTLVVYPEQMAFEMYLSHFRLVSVCLHAGFTCIFLVAQYRYHSAAQPQLPLDIFIISAYICICLSLTQLKNALCVSKWWCLESSWGSLQGQATLKIYPENVLSYQFISDENNPALP